MHAVSAVVMVHPALAAIILRVVASKTTVVYAMARAVV